MDFTPPRTSEDRLAEAARTATTRTSEELAETLTTAAENGDSDAVTALIAAGADINTKDEALAAKRRVVTDRFLAWYNSARGPGPVIHALKFTEADLDSQPLPCPEAPGQFEADLCREITASTRFAAGLVEHYAGTTRLTIAGAENETALANLVAAHATEWVIDAVTGVCVPTRVELRHDANAAIEPTSAIVDSRLNSFASEFNAEVDASVTSNAALTASDFAGTGRYAAAWIAGDDRAGIWADDGGYTGCKAVAARVDSLQDITPRIGTGWKDRCLMVVDLWTGEHPTPHFVSG